MTAHDDTTPNASEPNAADSPFSALGLDERLVEAVTGLGYEEPTPIQREGIPVLLEGRDVLGMADTGTGKTAAFALPLLHHLIQTDGTASPFALILVPTRELAMQVAQAVHTYGRALQVQVLPVYGGAAMGVQLRALRRGVDVVVGTPGRVLDHIRRGSLVLDDATYVVLDEADEMLDMGFQEDLEEILAATPNDKQMALFSATFPERLARIAEHSMQEPVRVAVQSEDREPGEMPRIRQTAYVVRRANKQAALARILDMEAPTAALVFARTRLEVDNLADALNARGYRTEALHGGLNQGQRDRVMQRLRNGTSDLVVATDVAARGLDVEHLSHVINYDAPPAPEQYVHRIGRTGRAGREGVAISLIEPKERRLLRAIERLTGLTLEVQTVPSVADLREKRMERLQKDILETIEAAGLEPFRELCDALVDRCDVVDIAAAAIKRLHDASWSEADEREIPDDSRPRDRRRQGGGDRWSRDDRGDRRDRGPRREHPRDDDRGPRPDRPERRAPQGGDHAFERVFVGLGRRARVRPGDLFGAVLNETGLPRDAVGAIRVTENYSIVEVPASEVDRVIDALRNTTLRGRRVFAKRDEGPQQFDDDRGPPRRQPHGERSFRGGPRRDGPPRGRPQNRRPGGFRDRRY